MRSPSANLDLLRSFAIVTVMIDHLIPTLVRHGVHVPDAVRAFCEHIGHAGVLAFFVHTSLVLMSSLERLGPEVSGPMVLRFYLRRFLRIYPLAIVCVLGVIALGLPDSTWRPVASDDSWREVVANLLLVQNLWTGHSVLVPLWSLPYEVEMYVMLPALYWMARRRDAVRWILLMLGVAAVLGYAFRKLEHGHMNMTAYLPCFIAGVLCYVLRDRVRARLPGALWGPAVAAMIAVYCTIHLISEPPIYWLGWGYCLALALAIHLFRESTSRVVNTIAKHVATYSYGLYLLHVPALYVVYVLWAPRSVVLGIVAYVALASGMAVLAYHLIEEPMVNLGRRLTDPQRRWPTPRSW